MKQDSPRWHYWIGTMLGLFGYDFPPDQLNLLKKRWAVFQENLKQTRKCLEELRELCSRLQYVERVVPQSDADLLPWRMSLYVDKPTHRSTLRQSLTEVGVSTSTLYLSLTDFSWDLETNSDLSTARDLHRHVLNLHHGSTPQAVRKTTEALRSLCNASSRQTTI